MDALAKCIHDDLLRYQTHMDSRMDHIEKTLDAVRSELRDLRSCIKEPTSCQNNARDSKNQFSVWTPISQRCIRWYPLDGG